MVIIKINRKLLKLLVSISLVISLGFNVYSYIQNTRLVNRYDSLLCIANQFDNTNLIAFFASTNLSPTGRVNSIELFDISKGEVIRRIPATSEIQKQAGNYLNGITGLFVKVKAIPDAGYIIKIPLDPSLKTQNHWLNDYSINSVDKLFIIFPEQGNPYLLVLDPSERPLFYNFNANLNVLLEYLNFQP